MPADMVKLQDDDPMLIAWNKYKETYDYHNSFNWASQTQHRDGSMWAAFMEGWNAAQRLYTPAS